MATPPALTVIARSLAIINIVASSVCVAADTGVKESCFIALHFAEGNTASIQLSNDEGKQAEVTVERYSGNGKLLDKVAKTVPAGGKAEVRLDLSSPTPELGWVRVLTKSKAVAVSTTLEVRRGDTLETLREQVVYRQPEGTRRVISRMAPPELSAVRAIPHKWSFDLINNLAR